MDFPEGRRFAFTIFDDTDVATTDNVRPVYAFFEELGLRTTKSVWSVACPEGSENFSSSETLEDHAYRAFVEDLRERGFEIAWHGATMESSTRDRTVQGLERFREAFGEYPSAYANHAYNRENLYWGAERFDDPLIRAAYRRIDPRALGYYAGHDPESPYWWGDLCHRHIRYVRNLTFDEINLLNVNPSMPYHDPSRPWVRFWFSAADANAMEDFNRLISPEAQDRLEAEGGVCIVATHLGKGFVRDGSVHPETRSLLERLASKKGWFPTVTELLDHLLRRRENPGIPRREWTRMQWRWVRDVTLARIRARLPRGRDAVGEAG